MFLNEYTIQDLLDLIAAKDYTVAQIQRSRDSFMGPLRDATWDAQWAKLKAGYEAAKHNVQMGTLLGRATFVPNSMIVADAEYRKVLASLGEGVGHTTNPGSLQDLYNRLATFKPIDVSQTPQPKSDFDASYMKSPLTTAVDSGVRGLENAGDQALHSLDTPWVKAGVIAAVVAAVLGVFGLVKKEI